MTPYEKHYSISKLFKFEASHQLNHLDYESPCKNIHGHSFKVQATITTNQLNKNGMIIDFSELKEFQNHLDKLYDHALILNTNTDRDLIKYASDHNLKRILINEEAVSEKIADRLCSEFHNMFESRIAGWIKLEIEVWETEKNSSKCIWYLARF